jgi:hypothetical protein
MIAETIHKSIDDRFNNWFDCNLTDN